MNMYGAFSYIWTTVGSTWNAYDPFTGRWEYTITGVPGGYRTIGPNGEILIYTMDNNNGWMTMWNSTEVVYKSYLNFYLSRPGVPGQPGGGLSNDAALAEYYAGRWRPHGITFNGTVGIQWNVTIPKGLPTGGPPSNIQTVVGQEMILGSNTNWAGGAAQPTPVFWAVSIKPGQEGQLLWNKTWALPTADTHVDIPGSEPASAEDRVFVVSVKETREHYGFSLDTGDQIWGPTEPDPWLNVFTNLYMNPWGAAVIKYGKLYTAGMGGIVTAYDVQTGQRLWMYNFTDQYTEQLFSSNFPTPITFIVDNKVYIFTQEHSANTPIQRGAPSACLDAETGEVIWRIDGLRMGTRWGGQPIIGDSIIAGFSSYDNKVVAVGRGPSAVTVNAPDISAPFGTAVVIKGSVTDISPGLQDDAIKLRFPNGVAAVSDDSQAEWMKYVWMQFPKPENCEGVPVTLSVVDANNNTRVIGTALSDVSGTYSFIWTPDIAGKYTIIAEFAGSKAYWPSTAETAMNVLEASGPTQEDGTGNIVMPPFETYLAIATIAIIIAIAIVGILLLRKK
jgi:hypothetical protein